MLINFDDDRPIFIQIAEMLQDSILSGAYPEESQIPSITEFAVSCKINPATALKGINILVDEGLIYKKRGLGMLSLIHIYFRYLSRIHDRYPDHRRLVDFRRNHGRSDLVRC